MAALVHFADRCFEKRDDKKMFQSFVQAQLELHFLLVFMPAE